MTDAPINIDQFLQGIGPFQSLGPKHLQLLAMRLSPVSAAVGDTIVRQGEIGDRCYLVREGEVEVFQEKDGVIRQMACLGPGAIFGEATLLTEAPRNASVRATQPSQLLSLRKADLMEVLSWDQRIAPAFFELLSLRDRPVRRSGILEERYMTEDGEEVTTLSDPARGTYFRLSSVGRYIWEHLDGHHNLKDLALGYMEVSKSFVPHAIAETLGGLVTAGFAESVTTKASHHLPLPSPIQKFIKKMRGIFQWRRMIGHADPWVARIYDILRIRYLYTRPCLMMIAIISIAGIVLCIRDVPQIPLIFAILPMGTLIIGILASLPIVVLLHDAGHAFTTRYFDRKVLGIGVGWNWFSPILYVDTTDIWPLPPGKRIAVHMAGIIVNLFLAGLASLIGLFAYHNIMLLFSLLSYLVAIINSMPIFNFDGHYALGDVLELTRSEKKSYK